MFKDYRIVSHRNSYSDMYMHPRRCGCFLVFSLNPTAFWMFQAWGCQVFHTEVM